MQPAFILLLVVAGSFLAFALVPNNPPALNLTSNAEMKTKNIPAKEFSALIHELHACDAASTWAKGKDLATVWSTCERGDWMLWLLGKQADKDGWLTRKQVVSIACDCAREKSLKVSADICRKNFQVES